MTSRKNIQLVYEGNSVRSSNFIRHDILPGHRPMEPLPPPEVLENRLAVQAMDIEQLAEDNHRLSATHVTLRQDFLAAEQEVKRLVDHIRSMQSESDIQIRIMLDKIAKMEFDIRAGESVKKELQQAHMEARSLALARKDVTAEIKQASQELEKARANVKRLPEMRAELDSLRKEFQSLRTTFGYEKGKNIEKVEKMRIMEKDIVGMAAELDRLRAEVFNAEQRAHAPPNPCAGLYSHPNAFYPPPVAGSVGYIDNYGRPAVQMGAGAISQGAMLYGSPVAGGAGAASAAGNPTWGGTYNAADAQK